VLALLVPPHFFTQAIGHLYACPSVLCVCGWPFPLFPVGVALKSCDEGSVGRRRQCSTLSSLPWGCGRPAVRATGPVTNPPVRQVHDGYRRATLVWSVGGGRSAATGRSRAVSASGISIPRRADTRSRRKELCRAGSKPSGAIREPTCAEQVLGWSTDCRAISSSTKTCYRDCIPPKSSNLCSQCLERSSWNWLSRLPLTD